MRRRFGINMLIFPIFTWSADHLRRLHRLSGYDGGIQRLSVKLQHGVLGEKKVRNKDLESTWSNGFPVYCHVYQLLTCMKLYVPCICAMRSCTACFLTSGSVAGGASAGASEWGSELTSAGLIDEGGC